MSEPQSNLASSVTAGVVIGLVVAVVFGYAYGQHKRKQVRVGWNLLPVVVASDDLKPGTVVTYDMISQRAVPEQFVTSSVVKPNAANEIIGQTLIVPMQAGDPMLWSSFANAHDESTCALIRTAAGQRPLKASARDMRAYPNSVP